MAPFTSPSSATKNTKWVTHLALSADVILGKASTTNCVHEIACTMDDADGQIHQVSLNCWARDTPEQGVYLLNNVPFATNPKRLGVTDVANLRRIPEEFDGSESGTPTLPTSPIMLSGIGVIASVEPDRKSGLIKGFTYISKGHQWAPFTVKVAFPDTPKYESWTMPGPRNLVDFDATVEREGPYHTLEASLIRITQLDAAPGPLLKALGVISTATDDRADRIRQAREANRKAQTGKGKSDDSEENDSKTDNTATLGKDGPQTPNAAATLPRAVSPTPGPGTRKRNRVE
ncbi:hypothetical protein CF326_g4054 [Tilletia indica]|nr:hypothetical protein CF326_g4054 [Tilletia indica]